jgi:hypothetical protein
MMARMVTLPGLRPVDVRLGVLLDVFDSREIE